MRKQNICSYTLTCNPFFCAFIKKISTSCQELFSAIAILKNFDFKIYPFFLIFNEYLIFNMYCLPPVLHPHLLKKALMTENLSIIWIEFGKHRLVISFIEPGMSKVISFAFNLDFPLITTTILLFLPLACLEVSVV